MTDEYAYLGDQLSQPQPTGGGVPSTFDTGTVTAVIDTTHVKVNLGDKEVTVFVPATLAGAAIVDATVRVSTQENTYVLDSVIQGAGAGGLPVGSITMWMTSTPPAGWLTLDGGTYSAAAYPALFAVLGTTTLPNMSDRVPVGRSGTKAVNTTGGAASVTLTEAQLPAHDHSMSHTHSMQNHTHQHLHDHGMNNHTHNIAHTHMVSGRIGVDDNNHTNTGNFATGDTPTVHDVQTFGQSPTTSGGPGPFATQTNSADPSTDGPSTNTTGASSTSTTGTTGSGNSVSVLQPYLSLNFIIKAL